MPRKHMAKAAPPPQEKQSPGLSPEPKPRPAFRLSPVLLLALTVLALYINTLGNGYVLDDFAAIVQNRIVTQGIPAIPELFSTPYHEGFVQIPNDQYRPLSLAMFAVEYHLFEDNPAIGHLMNVVVFMGCVLMLFRFLDLLFGRRKTGMALLAAFLFALHPVHTEVVANIKSRDELLCFLLAFGALYQYLRYADTGRIPALALGAVLYFGSLLSKESSITLVLVIPLVFFLYKNANRRRSLYITLGAALSAGLFLILRYAVLRAHNAADSFSFTVLDNALVAAPTGAARLATAIYILGKYLWLLIVPYPLVCDYSFNSIPVVTFGHAGVILSALVYLGLLIFGIYRLVKHPRDVLGLGIAFFLITLSLFSNIFFLTGATMAERFLFFPSAGFAIAAAGLLAPWAQKSAGSLSFDKRLYYLMVPLTLIYGGLSIARNRDWKDGLTLYKADLAHAGNNYRIPYYLGSNLINASNEEGDPAARQALYEEAVVYLKQSIGVYPDFAIPYSQIGVYYTNTGVLDSAEWYNKRALALNPTDTFTRNNLAAVYFKQARYREAIDLCRENLRTDPTYARAYMNIGSCYLKMGIPDSAVIALKQAGRYQPELPNLHYYISVAYSMAGNADSARKYESLSGMSMPR